MAKVFIKLAVLGNFNGKIQVVFNMASEQAIYICSVTRGWLPFSLISTVQGTSNSIPIYATDICSHVFLNKPINTRSMF